MLSENEIQILQFLANFADIHDVNKSEIARKIGCSQRTVRNTIKRFKEKKINVGK